jgi:hypothetical protein
MSPFPPHAFEYRAERVKAPLALRYDAKLAGRR